MRVRDCQHHGHPRRHEDDSAAEDPIGHAEGDQRRLRDNGDNSERDDVHRERATNGSRPVKKHCRTDGAAPRRYCVENSLDVDRRLRTRGRIFLEALHNDVRKLRRYIGTDAGDVDGRLREMRGERPLRRTSRKRRLTRKQLIGHAAEGVDVRAVIDVRIARGSRNR